jgi:hypothetical protein
MRKEEVVAEFYVIFWDPICAIFPVDPHKYFYARPDDDYA